MFVVIVFNVLFGNNEMIIIDFFFQGFDLLEDSLELIYAGEMNKVNFVGWF